MVIFRYSSFIHKFLFFLYSIGPLGLILVFRFSILDPRDSILNQGMAGSSLELDGLCVILMLTCNVVGGTSIYGDSSTT